MWNVTMRVCLNNRSFPSFLYRALVAMPRMERFKLSLSKSYFSALRPTFIGHEDGPCYPGFQRIFFSYRYWSFAAKPRRDEARSAERGREPYQTVSTVYYILGIWERIPDGARVGPCILGNYFLMIKILASFVFAQDHSLGVDTVHLVFHGISESLNWSAFFFL